ncbi:MAG: hypothetical protein ACK559_19080, partial [bacterium]
GRPRHRVGDGVAVGVGAGGGELAPEVFALDRVRRVDRDAGGGGRRVGHDLRGVAVDAVPKVLDHEVVRGALVGVAVGVVALLAVVGGEARRRDGRLPLPGAARVALGQQEDPPERRIGADGDAVAGGGARVVAVVGGGHADPDLAGDGVGPVHRVVRPRGGGGARVRE